MNLRNTFFNCNRGKGAALLTAFRYAKQFKYDWMITLDGDGQHSPRFISHFIREIKVNNTDIILGNRIQRSRRMPLQRILSNGITSVIISLFAGNNRIHDSQCGFRAVRVACMNLSYYSEKGFQLESEMILRFGKSRLKMKEIPIETQYGGETSDINVVTDTGKFILLIIKSLFW